MHKIVVMTHNPNKEHGDVRPLIEKENGYKKWKKSIKVEKGQIVLIYVSGNSKRIEYIMKVENVYEDSMDLLLIEKLSEDKANKLKLNRLQENGFNNGTVNYILDNNKSLYSYVISVLNIKNKELRNNNMKIKNIMLYGAPGVGKTYNYKRLISLIEEGKNESEIFNIIKEEDDYFVDENIYADIKKDKRVEFVTFHQSYSYEDFIEGFRPNENGNIELEDGIFKVLCNKSSKNLIDSSSDIKEESINLDELIFKFTNYVQDELDNNKEFILEKEVTIKGINNKNAFLLGGSIKSPQRLTPDIIKRDYKDFKSGIISNYEDISPTRESKSLYHGNARYYFMLYKKINEFENRINLKDIEQKKEEQKNFYIVIDEINRGNISKIFGELITLIEEDKRDNLEVTLPYSKEKFKIPSNLYIIATMNSTDKSIATIDIALRRRFTFLKMHPKPELVKDTNAKELMEKLNVFIKETRGEDFMLGHSYFMNGLDLEFIKEYKIKPLLEEYFYGDEENYKKAEEILKKEV